MSCGVMGTEEASPGIDSLYVGGYSSSPVTGVSGDSAISPLKVYAYYAPIA